MLHHTLASQNTGTMSKYLISSDICIIEDLSVQRSETEALHHVTLYKV